MLQINNIDREKVYSFPRAGSKCSDFTGQSDKVVDKPLHDCLTLHCTCTPGITKVAPPARPVTIMAEVLTVPGESLIIVK